MKKLSLLLFCVIILVCSCKQIVGLSIENSVKDLNEKCPIGIEEDIVLNNVKYINNAICFYLTVDENSVNFTRLSSEHKEELEKSMDFKRRAVGMCFFNDVVKKELNNLTETMADEVDLTFRVFLKGATSGEVIKTELSWKEIQDLRSDASEW